MEALNKKERTKNFTESEKMLLVELVQQSSKIVENKTTNGVSIKEKEDCWEDLQAQYMSRSKGVLRTVQSLKTCWENIKKRAKKQYAEEKQAIYKTGGGQYKAVCDPIAEQVRKIIRPAVEGLTNVFDNDCSTEPENDFVRNAESVDEWLEEGVIENVTDRITEDVIEIRDDVRHSTEGDERRTDDDEFDTEENFPKKEDKVSWKKWNPQKLQTKMNTLLKTSMRNRMSTSSQNKILKENVIPTAHKDTAQKTSNQLKKKTNNYNNNRLDKFATLADNKKELVSLMMANEKEKHELEIEILKRQLLTEELEIKIMKKELEWKTVILEREQQRLKDNVL